MTTIDELQHLRNEVERLTSESAERLAEIERVKCKAADLIAENERVKSELQKAQAACAEMRTILEIAQRNWVSGKIWTMDASAINHALSTDCGSALMARVAALERALSRFCDISNTSNTCVGNPDDCMCSIHAGRRALSGTTENAMVKELDELRKAEHNRKHHTLTCPRCTNTFHEKDMQGHPEEYWTCPLCGCHQHTKCRVPLDTNHEFSVLLANAANASMEELQQLRDEKRRLLEWLDNKLSSNLLSDVVPQFGYKEVLNFVKG